MLSPRKKFGLSTVLAIFTAVTLAGSFLDVKPARAQLGVSILTDLPKLAEEITTQIKEGLGVAILNGALRAVAYASRKIAYDAAVWAASGGKGQQPLAFKQGFKKYSETLLSESFGEAVSAIEDQFGVSICQIPDVKLDLALRIGLRGLDNTKPIREGDCDFNQFTANWSAENLHSKYGTGEGGGLAKQFNATLKTEDTDFGVYLDSVARIDENVKRSREGAILERQEGDGTKGLTDYVSGDILTPAQEVKKFIESNTPDEQIKADQATIYAAIGSGFVQVIPSTISTFLNTLAGTMLKNFMTKGTLPFGVCVGEIGGDDCKPADIAQYEGSGARTGRQTAQSLFRDLLVPTIGPKTNFDIVAELSSCPETPSALNCRMDSYLVSALAAASIAGGEPMTIKKALKDDLLHKQWRLLPPNFRENTERSAYDRVYTYANIKALRLARILPLGFEIAAFRSNPDVPWTLQDVVNGYNNCDYVTGADGIVTVRENLSDFPYCHLIDPNWILTAPTARCDAYVFGNQTLSGGVPNRLQECVDLSSVVAYNQTDRTPLSYAYCAREKNVWDPSADTCDPHYATCLAYTDPSGQQVGYLQRTLDTGACNSGNVGCNAYSLTQNSSGEWLSPGYTALSPYNYGINFNNKISSSCGSNSAGCSAFKLTGVSLVGLTDEQAAKPLNLRKAPDYLGCYDAKPTASNPGVQWPTTAAELSIIEVNKKAQCADYSQACIASEVGCNMFTAVKSGLQVPGKFTPANFTTGDEKWNDQCHEVCDGYDGYVRLADNYSNGSAIDYIVPTAEASCRVEEVGCSSFTNMSAVREGGEQVEYFSLLRSCIKPDAAKQKNFYTYEGSTVGGYQLKVYTLEKDDTGGPKYFYKVPDEINNFNEICSEAKYKNNTAATDCRQFNDDQGNVYYRLLGKTVVVSDKCTPYRLNSAEFAASTGGGPIGADPVCFQNGDYKAGFCYYNGLPGGVVASEGQSQSCSAAVESCHAYKGNAGNNIENVATLDFENTDTALSGWSAGVVSSVESIKAGGRSLGFTGTGIPQWTAKADGAAAPGLVDGASYSLSFWAKGRVGGDGKLKVELADVELGEIQLSDVWRLYEFGAKQLGDNADSARLVIGAESSAAKTIYLDNLRLVKVVDSLYLVQKKLTVDQLCDATPEDNLPGEALGCKGYTVPDVSATFYLKNFSYLCRENAIGCTALIDTYNTLETEKPKAYNVWISAIAGDLVRVQFSDGNVSKECYASSYKTPLNERVGCYVDIAGYDKSDIKLALIQKKITGTNTWENYFGDVPNPIVFASFLDSTTYVPADTAPSTPVYLVANKEATCNQIDLGCTYAGLQKQTPAGVQFTTVTIKNDPAQYDASGGGTLCQAEAVGCNVYNSTDGQHYFKDPLSTGQKVCSYRPRVEVDGAISSGWFWKDVGKCADTGDYCSADSDCNAGVICEGEGNQPCYPDYHLTGNSFGIWSYGDRDRYDNFVGECPTAQNGCAEFIDRNDSDKSYFWIKNNKIDYGTCGGQVSLKEGCVLFDQADAPRKLWNTAESYAVSENNEAADVSRLTDPVDGGPASNDANVIVKVTRNRECGEWLQCVDSHTVYDPNVGWKEVCDSIGRCDEGPYLPEQGEIADCANLIDPSDRPELNKILTVKDYVERDVAWTGMDYSGYSFLNMYQPDVLGQYDIGDDTADWRLAKAIPCAGVNCARVEPPEVPNTARTSCENLGDPCGAGGTGVCLNRVCLQTPYGTSDFDDSNKALKPTCRAYPEETSPFPNTRLIESSPGLFGQANKCDELSPASDSDDNAFACECSYIAAEYGQGAAVRYFNKDNPNNNDDEEVIVGSQAGVIPQGICVGGFERVNESCDVDRDCGTGGTCQKIKKQFTRLGWQGYCLEPDLSRNIWGDETKNACLSWLPVGPIAGAADVYSQFDEAGYQTNAGLNGEYYCLNANGYQSSYDDGGDGFKTIVRDGGGGLLIETDNFVERQFDGLVEGKYRVPWDVNVDEDSDPYDDSIAHRNFWKAHYYEERFLQSDIEFVEFTAISGDSEDPNSTEGKIKIYPNFYKTDGPYLVKTVTTNGAKSPGKYFVGNYMGKQNLPAVFYSSRRRDPINDDTPPYYISDAGVIDFVEPTRGPNPPDDDDGNDSGSINNGGDWVGEWQENQDEGDWDFDWDADLTGNLFASGNSRIKIHGSYVPENSLGFFSKGTSDDMINQYPLGLVCSEVENSGDNFGGNWHGVVMHFDPADKKFLGYWVIYCNDSGNDGGVQYKVEFKLRNTCRSIADTVVEPGPNSAVGWTNRLWGGNTDYVASRGTTNVFFDQRTVLNFDQAVKPFGGLGVSGDLFSPFNLGGNPADNLRVAYLTNPEPIDTAVNLGTPGFDLPLGRAGLPYSCTGLDGNVKCKFTTDAGGASITNLSWASSWEGTDENLAKYLLGQVFAKQRSVYSFDFSPTADFSLTAGNYYRGYTAGKSCNDTGSTLPEFAHLSPPRVRPVSTVCLDSDPTKCYEVSTTTGMTINNVYSSDIKLLDSPAKVTMKFYAYADADRMPLRSLQVDWGDGSAGYESGERAFFRNRRGSPVGECVSDPGGATRDICRASVGQQIQGAMFQYYPDRKCDTDDDCMFLDACIKEDGASEYNSATDPADFGHIAERTCDNTYYQFEHFYRCTSANDNWFEDCPAYSSEFPTSCCVFQPAVQVKDNWGWCNGSCSGGPGGSDCYDDNDFDDPSCSDPARRYVGDGRTGAPLENNECDTDPNGSSGPWTYFGGSSPRKIYVAPSTGTTGGSR